MFPPVDRVVYTTDEAAALLGVSRATVYRMYADGSLPYVRVHRSRRVPWEAIARLVSIDPS